MKSRYLTAALAPLLLIAGTAVAHAEPVSLAIAAIATTVGLPTVAVWNIAINLALVPPDDRMYLSGPREEGLS